MKLKQFLKLVEIQTKIASVFPFIIGLLFTIHRYDVISPLNTFVFFCAMILFDMTTTAINNYLDYKKAIDVTYKETQNIIGKSHMNETLVLCIIIVMLILASSLGLFLVYLTNVIVLLIGLLCFAIGIFYTFGPLPLSRLPLGEVFSGVTMGFGIIFLTIYVNTFHFNYFFISLSSGGQLNVGINLVELVKIILVAIPSIFTISNLMLANNICDLEEDVRNKRHTLVYFIGKKRSIGLFGYLYAFAFLSIVLSVFIGIHHEAMLISLIAIPLVFKGVKRFKEKQVKSETFVVAVKNLVLIDGIVVIGLVISLLLS